jgi:hypothetical protein
MRRHIEISVVALSIFVGGQRDLIQYFHTNAVTVPQRSEPSIPTIWHYATWATDSVAEE